jgi:hypothetical protein
MINSSPLLEKIIIKMETKRAIKNYTDHATSLTHPALTVQNLIGFIE